MALFEMKPKKKGKDEYSLQQEGDSSSTTWLSFRHNRHNHHNHHHRNNNNNNNNSLFHHHHHRVFPRRRRIVTRSSNVVVVALLFVNVMFLGLNIFWNNFLNISTSTHTSSSSSSCNDINESSSSMPTTTTTKTSSSSSSKQHHHDHHDDGPPSNLVLHGQRLNYTPCPIEYWRNVYVPSNKEVVSRTFQSEGWFVTNVSSLMYSPKLHFIYRGKGYHDTTKLKPYQRFARITNFVKDIDTKDNFLKGFQQYAAIKEKQEKIKQNNKKNNILYFLPETYNLNDEYDQLAFQKALTKENQLQKYKPWVLKETTLSMGRGITMIPPNSHNSTTMLNTVLERINNNNNTNTMNNNNKNNKKKNYIIQEYVCNELKWNQGQKFDLRFYWMVVSIDPLIVLYHDGFVRVANTKYNETDFSSGNTQHLTNTAVNNVGIRRSNNNSFGGFGPQRATTTIGTTTSSGSGSSQQTTVNIPYNDVEDVLPDALWRRIRQHYKQNEVRLSKRISKSTTTNNNTSQGSMIIDPAIYVRNQLKDIISTTADAFKDVLTSDLLLYDQNGSVENRFAIYGCDFIIDEDLDVWYIEAQHGPSMKDSPPTADYKIDLYRKLLRPMIKIVEEIAFKQQTDPKANLLPIENLGEWEIVYAGIDQWRYQFHNYQRITNDKKGCM